MDHIETSLRKIEENVDYFELSDEDYRIIKKCIKKVKYILQSEYSYGVSKKEKDKVFFYMDKIHNLTGINDLKSDIS